MKYLVAILILLNGAYIYRNEKDKEKTKLLINLSLVSNYCNRYNIRDLQSYGPHPGSYPKVKTVMFPDVCIRQALLDQLLQVKYGGFIPNIPGGVGLYDSYYTGLHYDSTNEEYKKANEETVKEIKELLGRE